MPSSRKRKIRAKYLKGLSKSDKAKQKAAIRKSRKDAKVGKYATRPKLKSFKSKKSPHVVKALKKFDLDSMKNLSQISRKTGCSTASMKTILRKGKGAYYSDGSRPNQNADSWAYARLASAITGGGASKVDYKQLVEGKCGAKVMRVAKKPKNFKKTAAKKSPKKSKKKSPRKNSRAPQKFKMTKKPTNKLTEKPWLSVKKVKQHEKEAIELKIPRTFLRVYEKHPSPEKLMMVKTKKDKNWRLRRNKYVMEQLHKYNQHPTPKRWLQLVMWGYKPPGRRPKKSAKRVKYVRKTSRGVARTFKMRKPTRRRQKKPRLFQGHVKRTRGGTPIIHKPKNLPGYNPNFSDVTFENILKSRLPPFQKYLLLGVWAVANYSPATKIPDIIQGDGGYLQLSDQTPGIIPMGAPSSYATYSPGKLVEDIRTVKPAKTRKDMRNYKKHEKKSNRIERKVLQRKILQRKILQRKKSPRKKISAK